MKLLKFLLIILSAISAGNTTPHDISEYLRSHEFLTASFGPMRFDKIGGVSKGSFEMMRISGGGAKSIPLNISEIL